LDDYLRCFVVLAFLIVLGACSAPPAPVVDQLVVEHIAQRPPPHFEDSDAFDWTSRTPWTYPVHGIDVARYQGEIDWPAVRQANVSFAYIKATEGGDHLDAAFRENWRGAARAGLLRGAYHYFYFCRSAAQQARWFIRHLPNQAGMLPPVLDIEWTPRSPTCRLRPEPRKVRAEMKVFLQRIQKHYGKPQLVYTTPDFYHKNQLWRLHGVEFWLRSVADHPEDRYPGRRWTFWQYTGTGIVPGVEGHTDINAFSGTPEQWQAWLVSHGVLL